MSTESSKPVKYPIAAPPLIPPPPHHPNLRQYHPQKRIITHTPPNQRSCFSFCCCFMWSLITLFILAALVAAATGVFWLLYKPQHPRFTIASLHLSNLNLTGNLDSDGAGHLLSSGNLTISAKNPNSKMNTLYDAVFMSTFTKRGVLIANASLIRGFASSPGNSTILRFSFMSDGILDLDSARSLRSELSGGKTELGVRVELETKMGVQIGKWTTKKIGIRVLCQGLRVKLPAKKVENGMAPAPAMAAPAMAAAIADDGSCKVNLSIKFWGFVF